MSETTPIERADTILRILYSVLFFIVNRFVTGLLGLVVVFELGYTLVTTQPPSDRVRDLGNRLATYAYRIHRYLTHNEPELPFPFADFPEPVEPSRWPWQTEEGT